MSGLVVTMSVTIVSAVLFIIISMFVTIKYIQRSKKVKLKKIEKLLADGKPIKEIIAFL